MEEKFLQLRQGREEQRRQRSKETAVITVQRQQYESEAELLEAQVTQLLQEGNVTESQQRLDALRTLVQDTANSISLTAHEMAKANMILARLQQLVDEKSSSVAPKKFKFSSRAKAKPTPDAESTIRSLCPTGTSGTNEPTAMAAVTVAGTVNSTNGFGNVYGPSTDTDLFINHSKGVFIRDCMNCTIYCLPIAGSVFLSACTNCRVYVACHQLRLKGCMNLDLYAWCASTPIIETCDAMRFGPYQCWAGLLSSCTEDGKAYPTHMEWVRRVGEIEDTARTERNYIKVDDFQWVKKSPSPHWRVLTREEERVSTAVFGPATLPSSSSAHPTAAAVH
ncbi:putative Tubulin binding cofactor C [Leishmania utingensis]|uniref:Tubulin binding cofactor C n=1 Tax=Leishmania utingensis TaxID=653362 RepID=A0AAW2ZWK2_9TRYP